jgi:hypothetical protein
MHANATITDLEHGLGEEALARRKAKPFLYAYVPVRSYQSKATRFPLLKNLIPALNVATTASVPHLFTLFVPQRLAAPSHTDDTGIPASPHTHTPTHPHPLLDPFTRHNTVRHTRAGKAVALVTAASSSCSLFVLRSESHLPLFLFYAWTPPTPRT